MMRYRLALNDASPHIMSVNRRAVGGPHFYDIRRAMENRVRASVVGRNGEETVVRPEELLRDQYTGVTKWDVDVRTRPSDLFTFRVRDTPEERFAVFGYYRESMKSFYLEEVEKDNVGFFDPWRIIDTVLMCPISYMVLKIDVVLPMCKCCDVKRCRDGYDFCTDCKDIKHLTRYYLPSPTGDTGCCCFGCGVIEAPTRLMVWNSGRWGNRQLRRRAVETHPYVLAVPDTCWQLILSFAAPLSVTRALLDGMMSQIKDNRRKNIANWNCDAPKYLVVVENFDKQYTYALHGTEPCHYPEFTYKDDRSVPSPVPYYVAKCPAETDVYSIHQVDRSVSVRDVMWVSASHGDGSDDDDDDASDDSDMTEDSSRLGDGEPPHLVIDLTNDSSDNSDDGDGMSLASDSTSENEFE